MIKLFSSVFPTDLEQAVNSFITNPCIHISSIQYSFVCIEKDLCHNILVIYEYDTANS